ncbi:MAG: hypothetical protein ABI067_02670 [Leifsonia sp.]
MLLSMLIVYALPGRSTDTRTGTPNARGMIRTLHDFSFTARANRRKSLGRVGAMELAADPVR